MKSIILGIASMLVISANASSNEYLVKFKSTQVSTNVKTMSTVLPAGSQVQTLPLDGWVKIQFPKAGFSKMAVNKLSQMPGVLYIQPNYKIKLYDNYKLQDEKLVAELKKRMPKGKAKAVGADNPAFPSTASGGAGLDPMLSKQWGMVQNDVQGAWNRGNTKGSNSMIVAVIDTGVDYAHEDLWDNMWQNPGETGTDANGADRASNGIDDDNNGYVDDLVGWDYLGKDNKPYDLTAEPMEMITSGGNPGHGTHVAGCVAARADNGKGIVGVAPDVKIMALRFIGSEGGTTADAISAIKYAVDNGAKVLNNSWGSEGEDPKEATTNQALRDAVEYAMAKDVLFIAAAGNGHQGVGYDNDSDPKPGYPASYPIDNIVSVAAIDAQGNLGSFSNWGARTVHIAAPGVKILSTVTDQATKYSDMVINDEMTIMLIKMLVEMQGGKFDPDMLAWNGTSMAAPHVAGAAALYWSAHPEKSYSDVKAALMGSSKKTSVMSGKSVSGGQLDVLSLMGF